MNSTTDKDKHTVAHLDRQRHVDAVLRSLADKKLVVAGPGTGKTCLFKTLLQGKTNTLTLTFVNALVEDLSLELFGLSEVRTLHGFARSQLKSVTQKDVRVFPKLSEVIKQDARILLNTDVEFDYLFHNRIDTDDRLAFYKNRRTYYGYYGFPDLVYAVVLYFELHEERIPAYGQVVVDEFQDFNTLEVSLIELLARKSPVLLAGDDDQALYESLKSASSKHIRQRHADKMRGYKCFELPYCSRSTRVIVETVDDIIMHAQNNGLLLERIEKPFRYFPDPEKDAVSDANPQIIYGRVFARQIPWFIVKHLAEITQQLRRKFTVLILSPTRIQSRTIYKALKFKGFRNVHFAEKTDTTSPSLLDGLKLLLVDSGSNLGWRIVSKELLDDTDFERLLRQTEGQDEGKKLIQIVHPSLKRRVKHMLTDLRCVRDGKELEEDRLLKLLDQIGVDAYRPVTESLRDELRLTNPHSVDPGIRNASIVVTTIQSSKGLSADYVFITHIDHLYCVRNKDVGMTDQDVCSFLVALTRARRKVYLLSTDNAQTPTFLTWIAKNRICEVKSPGAGDS